MTQKQADSEQETTLNWPENDLEMTQTTHGE